ncbi:hypothetical protein HRI_002300800 [Hibiscus trionum]|uniref:SBP-type domain-containing protein n=1 Tax=Hibiscus trionum TaxID=183268 RepID=A0A9W7M5C3_HIBTR|nr:hypothetical protein HRI_002300800 [Hibiscus trionum]
MAKRSFDVVGEDDMGLTEEEGSTESEDDEEQREERKVMIRVVSRERFETTPLMHGGSSCGGGGGGCQADECGADLKDAKQYHRRHRVCEPHAKAAFVSVKGIRQRFCQQCSRFHEISKFDGTKRSCRDRLADHNLRRRKVVQSDQETEDVKRLPTSSSNITNKSNKNRVKMKGVGHPMDRELTLQSCSKTSTKHVRTR